MNWVQSVPRCVCVCVDQMGALRSSIWSPIFGKSLWPSPALLLALCTVKAGTCPLKFLKTIETISDKRAALLNTQEKAWRSISEYWSSVASLLLSTSHIDHLLLSTSPTLKPRGALFSITPCVKHSIWSPDKRTSYIVRNYYKNLSFLVCKLHYFQNIILMGLIVWGLFFRSKKYME